MREQFSVISGRWSVDSDEPNAEQGEAKPGKAPKAHIMRSRTIQDTQCLPCSPTSDPSPTIFRQSKIEFKMKI